jgi:hemolysin D
MGEPARKQEEPNEFSTEAIALQTRPPSRLARAVTLTLCLFALLAVVYAVFARMDVVITATGRVVPSGKAVIVQAFEPATVRSVLARDGQRVKAGDVLVMLSPLNAQPGKIPAPPPARPVSTTTAPAEPPRALLDARLLESLTKLATLDAEVTRRRSERDAIAGVIDQLNASMALVNKRHAMRDQLARSGHMTQANLIESKLELINLQKEISIQQNRLREAESALNAALQSRTQADAEYKARFPEGLVAVAPKPEAQKPGPTAAPSLISLVAPTDGVVQWLAPLVAGDTVSATQNLLVVVPENASLAVEALVFNKDIGHLRVSQQAVVKIETFDYTRYGHIDGTVQWVGADAITDPKLGPVYASRVLLKAFETPNIVNGRRGQLAPGMNVTVDVRVTERRMIEYFLAPLLRYKEESLRER